MIFMKTTLGPLLLNRPHPHLVNFRSAATLDHLWGRMFGDDAQSAPRRTMSE